MLVAAVLALGMPGYQEIAVLVVIGLLVFGRRLPEVGRKIGQTVVQLRRGIQDFKDQMRDDEELQEVRSTVHDLKKAVDVPRTVASPRRMLEKLAEDAMHEEPKTEESQSPETPGEKKSAD